MESSPVSENCKMEVDLCTPAENLKKHYQEITPDNPTQPETTPLLGAKKAIAVGFSQKLSKRKLFGQLVDQASENENVSETVHKKKRSDHAVKNVTNDNTQKRLLTERQQLAFLLEATSTRESTEDENDSTFTKVKSRTRIKRNGKCVNPRVYRRNERGETPLHLAAIKGDIVSLKKLIKDGAQVGLKDYAGWTALHEACNHGNLEAAKLLVKRGAGVNVPGFEGDTPLHDAVVNNHVEVVNMLLSCGANPHQTNTRRKKPTDLISTKEMSDIFNLRGILHTGFEKADMKVLSEEIAAAGSTEKTHNPDNERSHARGSILGNEIQRKETQGESKMEKPVMYICKLEPRNEELTMRTTQVTSYKKCGNVEEDGGTDPKNIASEGCKVQEPDTPRKKVLGIGKTDRQDDLPTEIESFTSRPENELKNDASSLQVASRGQPEVYENTENKLSASTSAFKTGAKETENEVVSSNNRDKVNVKSTVKMPSYGSEKLSSRSQEIEHSGNEHVSITNHEKTKEKLAVSSNGSEELNNRSEEISEKKKDSISVQGAENENTKRYPSLFMPASEDPPTEARENNSHVHVDRSRTPEIDESIAVEVLSTGLFSGAPGFSQYYGSLGQQDNVMTNPSYIYSDVPATDVSGSQRFETPKIPSYSYRGVSVTDEETSLNDGSVEQEASEQSSVSNDELFLDVEGLEPDLKENEPSLEVHLLKKEQSAKQSREQENVISSTSHDNDDEAKSKEHAASLTPMNERSGLLTVAESRQIRKQSNAYGTTQTYLSNSYGGTSQSDSLGASKLTDQHGGNKFTSENISLNTDRSEKFRSSAVEHTRPASWKYDDTTSEKDGTRFGAEMVSEVRPVKRGGDNVDDFRPWQLEKKRGRRQVDLMRKSTITLEDDTTRQKAGQPISSGDHGTSWVADTRSSTGRLPRELRNSQADKESTRLAPGVNMAAVKPSKPTVTWQSLMAAGRCQLGELRVPGYDQFLMKTKQYELATDVNQEKGPAHSTEEKEISLKREKSKEELLRKQRSEQEKLQLCMEQEIVRFYTKKAYSSLKCNQPPGVCTAIYWQNMSSRQLQSENKKLSQKLHLETDQDSPSDHQEITEKYEKLKSAMANRHEHEQQALDAVTKREFQSCV